MVLDIIVLSVTIYLFHLVAIILSVSCHLSCVIPFTIDQLVGASGEELSFTIYWIVWAWWTFGSVPHFFNCYLPKSYQLHQAALFSVCSLSFIPAYLITHCYGHVLMTKPQPSNSVKLVLRVLKYAWKHKFPERRSAFTYWEDECPSRIDLGKEKYGSPFTVEEVENVKTIFKLLPLIVCIAGTLFLNGTTRHYAFHTCEIKDVRFYFSLLLEMMVTNLPPFDISILL